MDPLYQAQQMIRARGLSDKDAQLIQMLQSQPSTPFDITEERRDLSNTLAFMGSPSSNPQGSFTRSAIPQTGAPAFTDPRYQLHTFPLNYENMGAAYAGQEGLPAYQQMMAQMPAAATNPHLAQALMQQIDTSLEGADANDLRERRRFGVANW